MIYFNGKTSNDFGVFVEKCPSRPVPVRKYEKVSIPGRNGDIIYDEDAFENVQQSYDIYISATKKKLHNAARAITQWLCVPGYRRLEDSYDPHVFRRAAYQGGTEIENILNEYGRATITFDCCPQRFLKIGEYSIELENGQKLVNPTGFAALPVLTVTCSNGGVLTVGEDEITIDALTGLVIIDSEEMECYDLEESLNENVSGQFPKLTGETQISWTGGITSVSIQPRWFEV